jgi:hypothetical protein
MVVPADNEIVNLVGFEQPHGGGNPIGKEEIGSAVRKPLRTAKKEAIRETLVYAPHSIEEGRAAMSKLDETSAASATAHSPDGVPAIAAMM